MESLPKKKKWIPTKETIQTKVEVIVISDEEDEPINVVVKAKEPKRRMEVDERRVDVKKAKGDVDVGQAGPSLNVETQTEFRCPQAGCGRVYKSRTGLQQHQNVHLAKYQCEYCEKCLPSKSQLQIHLRVHTDERPFTCEESGCGKMFKQKTHLESHIKKIHRLV